ncbi:hypothetical protein JL108_15810 [Aeromicrobium sp. YIM 150415]|uniref:Lipoprotein n=1 Tax=Aeromicrobium piscarium TaxID=2590901 RepID=A0A554S6U6_9ACTN|nr:MULTISPECIES: hypothetical protein [Aeromicrobium]MBM9464917.1 hypothetical protein [Aeromicrobium sp. YIM 150415]TSD62074.1 hypothetical protein FNM00_13230 [Aeromicrobium piscarium]
MRNRWVGAAVVLLATTTLSGCFGSDPYCDAVKEHEETLNSFGAERTDAAYADYATAAKEIAEAAPESIAPDWETIAEVTDGVIAAQSEAGVPLENMGDSDTVAQLSQEQRDALNASYQAFNDTVEQRRAVVADIDDQCGVTLEQPEAKE